MRLWLPILFCLAVSASADWPQFLGTSRDGKAADTGLVQDLSKAKILWAHPRGESYSAPSIAGGRVIHHGRKGAVEIVECLDRRTGRVVWSDKYPTTYRDRFNYLNGPRASPAIDGGRVYTLGAQGILGCYALDSGNLEWRRDLVKEFKLDTEYFGFAPSPLVEGGAVIINLGMKKCVAAFDKLTGATKWVSGNEWGRSYASPVAATMHGKRLVFVFAGGESSPPVGGLLCVDPETGEILDRFPWRSPRAASANASTPVVDGNRVFISSSYDVGGLMLEVTPEFKFREVYRTKAYASHWATPILVDGYLYGFANNKLVCMDWETGERMWRTVPKIGDHAFSSAGSGRGGDRYRPPPGKEGFGIGSLVFVDGRFLVLGENGLLAWMDLSPEGCKITSSRCLFKADQTWTAPVLSDGCTYICQNLPGDGTSSRLLCLDLKTEKRNGK